MPRGRKPKAQPEQSHRAQPVAAKRFSRIDWSQSYTSLLFGIIVVIVGVLFVVSLVRNQSMHQQTSSISTQIPSPTLTPPSPTPYIVQTGDNLWDIAVTVYHNGYQWPQIAKANNLTNPSVINQGQTLVIPSLSPTPTPQASASSFANMTISPTPTVTPMSPQAVSPTTPQAITGGEYIVQKGDDLWDIAVRAYGDGYRWTDIAKANNLANPRLIFSGNVLTIPR